MKNYLLGQFRNAECVILLGSTAGQGGKAGHEEVETREWNHVDGQLAEIGVELSGESEASGDAGHGQRDEMVQVSIGGRRELERAETDVVESLVVDTVRLVRVLNQLMDRQSGVVRLDDGVGHLGRRHDGECVHNTVRILFANLGDQEGPHA